MRTGFQREKLQPWFSTAGPGAGDLDARARYLGGPIRPRAVSEQKVAPNATVAANSAESAIGATAGHGVDSMPPGSIVRRFVRAGTAVEMTLLHADPSSDRPAGTLRAGDDVTFRFRITTQPPGHPSRREAGGVALST